MIGLGMALAVFRSIPTRKLQLRRSPRRLVVPADEVVLEFVEMDLPHVVADAVVRDHRIKQG